MTGFVYVTSACFCCKQPFNYNPHKVPSHRHNGVREPVCQGCMALINTKRAQGGLEPFPIDLDAYSAIPEHEL
jgi:hypothetical protein